MKLDEAKQILNKAGFVLNERIDDYTKFGWEMRYTAEFVARTILDDLYLD